MKLKCKTHKNGFSMNLEMEAETYSETETLRATFNFLKGNWASAEATPTTGNRIRIIFNK